MPSVVADSVVNLCGAIGLAVAAVMLHRRDPRGPQTARLVALLALVASLFLLRGIAWWTDNSTLDRISLIPAALIPLGALIVTEGLLRRHAHRRLKVAALVGGGVLALAGALGPVELENVHTAMLSAFQLAGFAVCAVLLIGRGRADLLAWENRAIDRVAFGAVLVIPFIITDFRVLAPDMPVRLGALGALLAVTAILIAGANDETQRQGVLLTVLRIVGAALLGAAAAALSADVDAAQLMRHCAVAVAGVLAIGLMGDALRAVLEARQPGVLDSIGASAATTRDALIVELARQPIFESARRYREADLAAYDPLLLRDFLAARRVLRRADAPWGLAATDPAVERMVALMTARHATHVIVLSHDPVDLIVLAVSVISADPATETALALVRRLLVQAPEAS
ncbi:MULTISPECIES: hypothetical protein [Bradyrhizobium]|uniref:Uncharacterized protein n=2 Tax=Bradyrhizobium TaxID=374 RepID=A0ABS5G5C2_9BRAD|nr:MULTISPECIES: hypothetical protein [Bradyrhizobium]MBR1136515.1 hypothetical protein [Bradyrhizobium denitrificans]MDU0954551.1 hypothetical protein [Bradyrhizobium sp.]MDU1494615.1 hypothetical protein [Bradyrhizobium sp.]MDU1547853.1 hypothetical protein [Bradyrhizobium sp.]MDU1803590.1 hypothetical protein [Bradyrhizobium sp.]